VRLLLAAAVSATFAASPAALAAGGGSSPSPQRLWRSYPLDSAHRGQLQPSRRTTAHDIASRGAAAHSNSGLSWVGWLGILIGVLVLITAAYALARHVSVRPIRDLAGRAWNAIGRATAATAGAVASSTSRAWAGSTPVEPAHPRALPKEPPEPTELATARTLREPTRPETRPLSGALLGEATPAAAAVGRASVPLPRAEPTKTREETVLKRKQRTSDRAVETLKEKRPASSGRARDVGLLKEKLAEAAPRRTNGDVAIPPAVPTAPAKRTPARAAGTRSCRIEWWRGYVKSEFQARLRRPDGSETVLLTSPAFRWSKATPPPMDLPHVAQAHAALVAELKAAGWSPTRRGAQWYALELQLRQVPARAERAT
jgi:hypothetical protein